MKIGDFWKRSATAERVLYAFMDEKTEDIPQGRRFITSCIGFVGRKWMQGISEMRRIARLPKRERLDRISGFLALHKGFGALVHADLSNPLIARGRNDVTADIRRMSRKDNVWSICLLYSLVPVVSRLHRRRTVFSEIEVYHDRKSLTVDHRAAIERTFRGYFSRAATEMVQAHGLNKGRPVRVTKVMEVAVADKVAEADTFQLGATLPHHVCAQSDRLIGATGTLGLKVQNVTARVESTLRPWESVAATTIIDKSRRRR